MNCLTTQNLLNGFADGELDLVNHLQLEEHLQTCAACRLQSENLLKIKSAVGDEFFYFKAPADLSQRIGKALREENPEPAKFRLWNWKWLTASLATVGLLVFGLLFFQSTKNNDELLAREVVSSHIRSMMADHLTDVPSSDKHTVKPWFEGKLDYAPPVSDPAAQGFPLVGGRLDYLGNRTVAALVYQRNRHFINLFVFPTAETTEKGNKMSERQGFNLINWSRSGMTFWAVSDLNLNELQEFTQVLQNQSGN